MELIYIVILLAVLLTLFMFMQKEPRKIRSRIIYETPSYHSKKREFRPSWRHNRW